jgi:hypothetical protein
MPILVLSGYQDLFTVAGVVKKTYYSDIHRGQGAAAYGAAEPIRQVLGLDAVALNIRDELNELGLKRKMAAHMTRCFFDRWVEGVSFVQHEKQTIVFGATQLDDDLWVSAVGPAAKLDQYIATLPRPRRRSFFVDLHDIIADIRARGEKAGLDMRSRPFFFPPDHPQMIETKKYWEAWRKENEVEGDRPPKLSQIHRKAVENLVAMQ